MSKSEYVKGSIMTRLFVSVSDDEVQDIARAGYDGEIVEHIPTRLRLHPNVRHGFYVEYEYSINDMFPLELRDDMPLVYCIEHLETLHRAPGATWVCGWFMCDTGKVRISEIGLRHEVFITADSVDNFNSTVQAFRNGEIKPAGSEQTVFQGMIQKVLEIEKQLALAKENEAVLRNSIEKSNDYLEGYFNKLKHSIFLVREYLACRGEYPDGIENMELVRLRNEIQRFKNRTFWQRLWNLSPTPIEVTKGGLGDDCIP